MSTQNTPEKLDEISKDLRGPTTVSEDELVDFFDEFDIPQNVALALPSPEFTASDTSAGYCCVYEIFFRDCGLRFPVDPLLLEYLEALKISIPQMCPNFLRKISGLITLAKENEVELTVADLVRLGHIKRNSKLTPVTFYLANAAGRGVLEGLPEKDTHWGRRRFFFEINEHSVGSFHQRLCLEWASSPGIELGFVIHYLVFL